MGPACVYNAAEDWYPIFSSPLPYENPNHPWTAGYVGNLNNLATGLTPYNMSGSLYGPPATLECLFSNRGGADTDVPNFCQNIGMTTVKGLDPGQVGLHPYAVGSGYTFSVLRFRAFKVGVYEINGAFLIGEPGTTFAYIYKSGTLLADLGSTPAAYSTTLLLFPGDYIDYIVAPGSDYFSDMTPVIATIRDTNCIGNTG